MDTSESLVRDFLLYRGYADIVYEPDGNVPPDFLIDGRIAVEVRRLNQNHEAGSSAYGLEEIRIPQWQKIEKLVLSLGPPTREQSWFIFYDFRRPVEPWEKLAPKLRRALQGFINGTTHAQTDLALGNGFTLEIFPASNPHPTFYVMGGQVDGDSGGCVLPEIERNLKLCIHQETEKRNRNARQRYADWWLILADHIGYGLDYSDQEQFRKQISVSHDWQKIILLDPQNHTRAFEI